MSETHIHIHLSGESPQVASLPKTKSKAKAAPTPKAKPKRKASAYSKKYGKAFKKVAPKHKKKSGGWKTGGFKRAQKEAHKIAKRMR